MLPAGPIKPLGLNSFVLPHERQGLLLEMILTIEQLLKLEVLLLGGLQLPLISTPNLIRGHRPVLQQQPHDVEVGALQPTEFVLFGQLLIQVVGLDFGLRGRQRRQLGCGLLGAGRRQGRFRGKQLAEPTPDSGDPAH